MRQEHDDTSRTMDRSRSRDRRDDRRMFGWDPERSRGRERHERHGWDHDSRRPSDDGRDDRFGPDADRAGMPRDETDRLIASSKVEGTPVYDRDGRKLGTICTLMIDKRSGQTEYAVLKYNSDFLGLRINERYYPLDWRELTYDRRAHGYGVDFTNDELEDRVGYDSDGRRVDRGERKRN